MLARLCGLVVSRSAPYPVGHGFEPVPGHYPWVCISLVLLGRPESGPNGFGGVEPCEAILSIEPGGSISLALLGSPESGPKLYIIVVLRHAAPSACPQGISGS